MTAARDEHGEGVLVRAAAVLDAFDDDHRELTLAALAATLQLYQDPDLAERSIPVLTLLATPLENLQHRAERLAPQLAATGVATITIVTGTTYLSGDPLAEQSIPTVRLAMKPIAGSAEIRIDGQPLPTLPDEDLPMNRRYFLM
jgi:seryl-tRNA(Sec) selenium transferase